MKKTTVICNDWQDMYLDHMSDEEAGRLFKVILAIRNGREVEVPSDFKYILTHMKKFWDDQDASYARSIEQRRQAALSRRHKDATPSDSMQPHSTGNTTPTAPDTKESVRIKRAPSVIDYSPAFLQFWDAYPKKKKKAMAYLRWNEALKGGADPDYIISKA